MRPFQQVLLFILFLCGDYSVISLVMVLVRKRYFRTHCSRLLEHDQLRRINTILPGQEGEGGDAEKGGFFNRTFTFNPRSPDSPAVNQDQERKRSDVTKKKNPHGLGGRMPISGPTDARAMGNFVSEEDEGLRERIKSDYKDRDESGMYGDGPDHGNGHGKDGILQGRAVQDSPISVERVRSRVSFRHSIEIAPLAQTRDPEGGQEELDGPTAQGSIDSEDRGRGLGNQQTPSTGLSHTRTIQIDDPIDLPTRQFQARQRIRSQSRAMSLGVGPSPKTQTGYIPNAPFVTTKTAPVSPVPRPLGAKNSGMGGFPGPTKLLPYLFPNRTKSTIHRHFTRPELQRKTTLLTNVNTIRPSDAETDGGWHESLATSAARWMPDTLASLVVGRNSRFFTEELDDEDLEKIGGVEYRALRLLSYAVAAVSIPYFRDNRAIS